MTAGPDEQVYSRSNGDEFHKIDPNHRQRMAVVPADEGKWALTHYETVEAHAHTSVVEFEPETGRTHQIRVHARSQGYPLLGDPKYGGQRVRYGNQSEERRAVFDHLFEVLPHPALHAYRLGFTHPTTGEAMQFEVEPPTEWRHVLRRLREEEGQE